MVGYDRNIGLVAGFGIGRPPSVEIPLPLTPEKKSACLEMTRQVKRVEGEIATLPVEYQAGPKMLFDRMMVRYNKLKRYSSDCTRWSNIAEYYLQRTQSFIDRIDAQIKSIRDAMAASEGLTQEQKKQFEEMVKAELDKRVPPKDEDDAGLDAGSIAMYVAGTAAVAVVGYFIGKAIKLW